MLIREGLTALLTGAGCEVVATAEDGDGVLREVALARPDVVVVDIRMPPTHTQEGITAAHRIRRDHPAVGVLVLSQYLESEYAMRSSPTPQHLGYLLKDRVSDVTELSTPPSGGRGRVRDRPAIVSRLMNRPGDTGPLDALTAREREVSALVAEGRSTAPSRALGMSQKTSRRTCGRSC
jgi:DNA-binding NarL/FixJ family response regulator